MGDLLPEVAVRAGREVAVPVRRRRPGRPRLHVFHRHRRHRRRQVSRRRPLGQVREMGRECGAHSILSWGRNVLPDMNAGPFEAQTRAYFKIDYQINLGRNKCDRRLCHKCFLGSFKRLRL